jgi:hypothetical protein
LRIICSGRASQQTGRDGRTLQEQDQIKKQQQVVVVYQDYQCYQLHQLRQQEHQKRNIKSIEKFNLT